MNKPPIFSPESDLDDLVAVERWLKKRPHRELIQIIAAPTVTLPNRLPGFTREHVDTVAQIVVVTLAQEEINRRAAVRMRLASSVALAVSGASALAAIASAFAAYFAHR